MKSVKAPKALQVALLGFGDFERSALVSYLRLSASRVPAYVEASSLASADYVVADADHTGTLDTVLGADRVADTVFIGSLAPDGALAWMMRPIDPLQVIREIDAAVTLRQAQAQDRMAPPAAPRAIRAHARAGAPDQPASTPAADAPAPAASTAATAAASRAPARQRPPSSHWARSPGPRPQRRPCRRHQRAHRRPAGRRQRDRPALPRAPTAGPGPAHRHRSHQRACARTAGAAPL